jgi:CheY-like chemotaxis protein
MLPSEPPCSRIVSRRLRILLVDDDPAVVRALARILRQRRPDLEVRTAASPARALQALTERSYDLVITDLQMPGGGGRAVLKTLRELYPGTARVVHSSQLESSNTLELCRTAHVVLAKPASESEILRGLERALSRVAAEREPVRRLGQ